MNAQVVHHNFAVILLGDGGVGKTTFFNKIIKKENKAYYNRRYNYDDFLL
jgi:GTPase SAR1 family protein